MEIGVNVPNFGPGTDPDALRRWAQTVEGLGFDLLMVSDHIAITPDVAEQYPAPFYEPFTTLSWLAGVTRRIRLGTTVLIVPYRHPLLVARMAANLDRLSGHRLVLGVGVGWARQEFEALGVPFGQRGRLTDEYLRAMRAAWADHDDYRSGPIPIWVGGTSDAAIRRAVRLGDAWHPLRFTLPWLHDAVERLKTVAGEQALARRERHPRASGAQGGALGGARTGPGHRGHDHDVHQLRALWHVPGRDRTVRARPRRVRPVHRAAQRAQAAGDASWGEARRSGSARGSPRSGRGLLRLEQLELRLREVLRIGEQLDPGDPAVGDGEGEGEGEDNARLSARCPSEPGATVDDGGARLRGRLVGAEHDVRIEHREQRVEVALRKRPGTR